MKSSKRILFVSVIVAFFIAGYFYAIKVNTKEPAVKKAMVCLGTVVEIQVIHRDDKISEIAIDRAFKEIIRIEKIFSARSDFSLVSRLNSNSQDTFQVDGEIYDLLLKSYWLWKISGGKYDVTIQSLMHLWGFDSDNPDIPSEEKIKEALKKTGFENIQFLGNNRIAKKKNVEFDFGSIAKGYAVERAIEILKKSGITRALVNAGGEIKGTGRTWIVGVAHPRRKGELLGRIGLRDMSVATSGDYQRYFEKNGKRYHHILDPLTGYPATFSQSVSIIHQNNMIADGLATAVFIMGRSEGLKLIEKLHGAEALIVDNKGKIFMSSGFKKYLIH